MCRLQTNIEKLPSKMFAKAAMMTFSSSNRITNASLLLPRCLVSVDCRMSMQSTAPVSYPTILDKQSHAVARQPLTIVTLSTDSQRVRKSLSYTVIGINYFISSLTTTTFQLQQTLSCKFKFSFIDIVCMTTTLFFPAITMIQLYTKLCKHKFAFSTN